ncbi:MAG: hypothetical protein M3Z96_05520 [Pseudomonadota bacterium]|nr:hypothetical protein [Pseudomonadota bacterium]
MEPHEPKEGLEPQPLRPWRKVLAVALGFLGLFFTFARDAEQLRAYNDSLSSYLLRLSPDKLIKELMKEEDSCYLDVRKFNIFLFSFQIAKEKPPTPGFARSTGATELALKTRRMPLVGHALSGRVQLYRGPTSLVSGGML